MRFRAVYINPLTLDKYYRIVDANDLNEARILAKRYCKKNYAQGGLVQDMTCDA
jgi:hypothetical protein